MKKSKILFTISQIAYGGAETSLLDICKNIDTNIFNVTVISLLTGDSLENEFKKINNINLILIGAESRFNILILFKLIVLFRNLKPDIIHTNLPVADIYSRLASMFIKTKVITTAHTVRIKKNFFYRMDVITAKLNHYFIANSNFTKDFLIKNKYATSDKISLIHLGLDFTKFQQSNLTKDYLLKKYLIPSNAKIVTHIGSFKEEKGHIFLLEAIKILNLQHPEYYYFFAGKGILLEQMKDLAKELQIDSNVIFAGNIQNISEVLSNSDVLVCPSISESFGVAIIEAMFMKVPVVAFSVDAIPELIKDEETGFLVEAKNSTALAKKIEHALQRNNEEVIEKAYQFVANNFSIKKTVKKLEIFYLNEVLKS